MKIAILTLLLATMCTGAMAASGDVYKCTTKQVLELSGNGEMETHKGIYSNLVGEQFSIHRKIGEMEGRPFDTSLSKSVTVLNRGSSENAYKAIILSRPPNIWVTYIYVAEFSQLRKKPFWGTVGGNLVFSGNCE